MPFGKKRTVYFPMETEGMNRSTFLPLDAGGMNEVDFLPSEAGGIKEVNVLTFGSRGMKMKAFLPHNFFDLCARFFSSRYSFPAFLSSASTWFSSQSRLATSSRKDFINCQLSFFRQALNVLAFCP